MILPGHTGFTEVISNVGKTETRGIDLSINTVNFDTKDFKWTTDLTFSANKEEITALNTNQNDVGSGWFIGSPTKVFYDYEKIGIWQTSEAAEAAKYGQEPGDIKVRDQTNDGAIDANNDRKVLGQQTPKWTAGLNNRFEYKGWELSFFLYARVGHLIQNEAAANFNPSGWNNSIACDYWTPENPNAAFPRYYAGANHNYQISDHWLQNAAYVRLKNLQLGYTIDPKLTKSWGIQRLRVYFSGDNLCEYSKLNDNFDPELSNVDGYVYPIMRNFSFGLNVTF